MSLASTLLKYLFIHQTARIPWSEVTVSRWPAPHKRPYWSPPTSWPGDFGLEFNVSHQAGLTALVGCETPEKHSSAHPGADLSTETSASQPKPITAKSPPRLGVDITCTNEAHRGPRAVTTQTSLEGWVDIFSEMFSAREREAMKSNPVPEFSTTTTTTTTEGEADQVLAKLRRFYACWSLKEAYIKMVGEGLLASWLTELEFRDVVAPAPARGGDVDSWGAGITNATSQDKSSAKEFQIVLHDDRVTDIAMELVAYGETFIVATAMKGVVDPESSLQRKWRKIDIERDIRPCAEGGCGCLQ